MKIDTQHPIWQVGESSTRRELLRGAGIGLGAMALSTLLEDDAKAAPPDRKSPAGVQAAKKKPRAKAVIYLHMSGAPPTLDCFDYKPTLKRLDRQNCPAELMKGERFAFIEGVPKILGSPHTFKQHGKSGMWVSDQLPHTAKITDHITMVHSMVTDQINHAPAEMFIYTGNAFPGNASMGSWITYGLGSSNKNLPGFVVLLSGGTDPTGGKSIWSSGYLPSIYQGVQCRSGGDPILFLNDPTGINRESRRRTLDALTQLNSLDAAQTGDRETIARTQQYELAYRMQMAVPDVTDIRKEKPEMLERYGITNPMEASFAKNCLLARRLVEQGVRYVQLYDWGWDIHGTGPGDDLMTAFPQKCKETDKAAAALVMDLKERGLLDDVLVVWGGEFGRTPMNEARGGSKFLGRDHHPHAFSIWMAGGGMKQGHIHGETDELGYKVAKDKVSVRDLQATILDVMGLDPFRLRYPFQGLDQRLIGPTNDAVVQTGLYGSKV